MGSAVTKNRKGTRDAPSAAEAEPAAAWMTVPQVVAWIAFRQPVELDRWRELMAGELTRSWHEWGFPFDFATHFMSEAPRLLLEAMQARAEGRPWRSPDQKFMLGTAWTYRAHVRRLMRSTGLSAAVLADQLRRDIDAQQAIDAKLEAARATLMTAVRDERLHAWGRRAHDAGKPNVSAEHEAILATLFLGPRTIHLDGWLRPDVDRPLEEWAGYRGTFFDLVRFRAEEVKQLWAPLKPTTRAVQAKINAETQWREWLTEQMRAAPTQPRPKAQMKTQGTAAKLPICTERAFERAWSAAVEASGALDWANQGRRKSPQSP